MNITSVTLKVQIETGAHASVFLENEKFASKVLLSSELLKSCRGGEQINVCGVLANMEVKTEEKNISENFYVASGAEHILLRFYASEKLVHVTF